MSFENEFSRQLVDGCRQLGVAIDERQLQRLLAYHQLLVKWNRAYNLTAVRDPLQMVSRHLLDSLSLVPFLQGERFIDVGTGAGLPGMVLAIACPNQQFDLLDSAGKKTRFLFQVKSELNISNIEVRQCRVEGFVPDSLYDGVISRAFASLAEMASSCHHLLKPGGVFYAMKGKYPADELEQLKRLSSGSKSYKVKASHTLGVPGEAGQRHLLLISPSC